jgi:predicted permease
MGTLAHDLRYAIRTLAKSPGFTVIVVLALALGIGANSAIFSVVNAVLLRPLPYPDADRLVVMNLSLPDYRDLVEGSPVFDTTAVLATNRYNLASDGASDQILGAIVSPGFFPLLGAPVVGRVFSPEEDEEALAVISHDLWRNRFEADPAVLGKTIVLSGRAHAIVGIMPPSFQFPSSEFKIWVTMGSAMAETPAQRENRSLRIFRAIGHLRPGVNITQAQAEADRISARLEREHPATNAGVRIRVVSLYERLVGEVRPALLVMLCAVGLLLLIACANVANLLLAKTTTREREIAIRAALGAGRWRIVRQFLTESVLLALLGGLFGLVIAAWGIDLLPKLGGQGLPRADSIRIDVPVLLVTFGASILTGILFGALPALHATNANLNELLKEGGRGAGGGTRGRRVRGGLVVIEVALSVVVLIGAGLLVQSFTRLLHVDPGFRAENLLTMNLQLSQYKDPRQRAGLTRQVLERIGRLPGVQVAGAGTGLPPQTAQRATGFEVQGLADLTPDERSAFYIAVTPGYFGALGTPLVQGRTFDDRDSDGAAKVVIVNESLARRLFPGDDALGRQLKLVNPEQDADWRTIVGVVGDVRYSGLDDPGGAAVYTPFAQTPFPWAYLMVRTGGTPVGPAAIQGAISAVGGDLTVARIVPMEQLVDESVAQPRFSALLISIFGGLALVLAAVGIYGVVSYSVAQRTREIGIRIALGARRADVLRLVVGQGMILTLTGIAIGIAGAAAVTRLLADLLFEVSPTDPGTFLAIAVLLAGVAFFSSYVPARRAARVDPLEAIRAE